MVKVKKGILKKTGCILISASIILTGVTFFGSSAFGADVDEPIVQEEPDNTETPTDVEEPVLDENMDDTDVDVPKDTSGDDENNNDDENVTPTDENKENDSDNDANVVTPVDGTTEDITSTDQTEEKEVKKEDLITSSLVNTRRTLATSLLAATGSTYTDPETGAVYTDSSMTTLVSIPSTSVSFTVPSSVTEIQSGAFNDSDLMDLTFANANNVSSIGTMNGWPAAGATINLNGASNDAYAVEFYRNLQAALIAEGTLINVVNGGSDVPGDSYSVAIIEKADDGSFNEVIAYANMASGAIIKPTSRAGYTCSDSYTVTTSASQTHTFTYTASSPTPETYNVVITEKAEDGSFNDTITYSSQTPGTVINPTTRSGYACSDTYTVTSDSSQSHTFVYTTNTGSTYDVAITEKSEDGTFVETLSYSKLSAGTVIYPTVRTGYTCSDTYTVTKDSSQSHTFNYKKESSGEGSGGSGGGGSSSGGGSGSSGGGGGAGLVTPSGAAVSDTAKLTVKYIITEGAGQIVGQKDGAVRIVCNGPVEKLAYINVDGNIVQNGNYTIQSGSTILTLNADYVANLAVGDHAVQFQYTDGYAMTGLRITSGATKTTTTVTYKVASDGTISAGHIKDTTPKTADGFDTRYLLCLAIFLLGAGAIQLSKQKNLEAILAGEKDDYC